MKVTSFPILMVEYYNKHIINTNNNADTPVIPEVINAFSIDPNISNNPISQKLNKLVLYKSEQVVVLYKILCCQAQYPIIYDWIAFFHFSGSLKALYNRRFTRNRGTVVSFNG
ncbi:MAG: hypothetical protein J6U05_02300 [Neisseriaceae bacterium]|nr:hypothetical protein [Neisseriaceae bacterium]